MKDFLKVVVFFYAVWCSKVQTHHPHHYYHDTAQQYYGQTHAIPYSHGYNWNYQKTYHNQWQWHHGYHHDQGHNWPQQAVSYDHGYHEETPNHGHEFYEHTSKPSYGHEFYEHTSKPSYGHDYGHATTPSYGHEFYGHTPGYDHSYSGHSHHHGTDYDQSYHGHGQGTSYDKHPSYNGPTQPPYGTTTFTPPTQRQPGVPAFPSTTPSTFTTTFTPPTQRGPNDPVFMSTTPMTPFNPNSIEVDMTAIGPRGRRPFDPLYFGTSQQRPYDRRFYVQTENMGNLNPNESLALQAIRAYASSTNFCDSFNPPKPDFSRMTPRVSQAQCEGFVFDRRVQIERTLRQRLCQPGSSSSSSPVFLSNANQLEGQRASLAAAAGVSRITIPGSASGSNQAADGTVSIAAVGGPTADVTEFPHMGAVAWRKITGDWKFKCGSILISPSFVLTAAHCTVSPTDPDLNDLIPRVIRFGTSNLNSAALASDVNIGTITTYPEYVAPSRDHDIAVMQLQRAVAFSDTVQPACLWNQFDITSLANVGTVTGWGVVGRDALGTDLREAELNIIEVDECNRLLTNFLSSNWDGITEYQICGGTTTGGVDTTEGDSGGPMQVQVPIDEDTMYYVVGVTSFGFGTGLPNVPGVYARVASYHRWIESIAFR